MAYNLKKEVEKQERLAGGPPALRRLRRRRRGARRACGHWKPGDKAVVGQRHQLPGGFHLYVSRIPPMQDSYVSYCTVENAAATISGVEAAYKVLKKERQDSRIPLSLSPSAATAAPMI